MPVERCEKRKIMSNYPLYSNVECDNIHQIVGGLYLLKEYRQEWELSYPKLMKVVRLPYI